MSARRSSVSSIPDEMRTKPSVTAFSPAGPAIYRGVDAAEARRRDQQIAALHESVHSGSIGEFELADIWRGIR